MRAGLLRHRVQLQRRENKRNEIGEEVPTWVPVSGGWAAIEPLRGRELLRNNEIRAETTHRVTMRWRPGLDTAQRIVFGHRYFNIESCLTRDERRFEVEMLCNEGLKEG